MSSIEEKLNALTQIRQSLSDLKEKMKEDRGKIESALSQMKSRWNDNQMEVFSAVLSKFTLNLMELESKTEKAVGFLENKYSTLQSHRN